ncbi:MAG: Hypothetical protein LKU_00175 [Lactobacillus kefiranofaciens]|nr:hypothetical protein WANG_1705 [Lactobacillus kefiranofaciens subsp. kefiranofaciens]
MKLLMQGKDFNDAFVAALKSSTREGAFLVRLFNNDVI